MRKRFFVCVSLVLVLSLVLGGCGSLKTAWVTARTMGALRETPVTGWAGNAVVDLQSRTLGVKGNSLISGKFSTALEKTSGKIFTEAEGELKILGIPIPGSAEFYGSGGPDSFEYVLHVIPPDLWTKGVLPWDLHSVLNMGLQDLGELIEDEPVLTSLKTQEGKAYALSFSLDPRQLLPLLCGENIRKKLEAANLSQVRIPVLLEIDGKTYMPKELRLELSGLEGDALRNLLPDQGKGFSLQGIGGSLTISEFRFGPAQIPSVPEEGIRASDSMEQLGSFFKNLIPG